MLSELYDRAKQVLADHRETLDRVAASLLERETLDGKELQLLREGKLLPPMAPLISDQSYVALEDIQAAFEALVQPSTQVQMVVRL